MFSIISTPVDTASVLANVEDPTCGGLVLFEGRVRNHHLGRDVLRLEYEAYQRLAQSEPGRRPVRCQLQHLPEEIGGGGAHLR